MWINRRNLVFFSAIPGHCYEINEIILQLLKPVVIWHLKVEDHVQGTTHKPERILSIYVA